MIIWHISHIEREIKLPYYENIDHFYAIYPALVSVLYMRNTWIWSILDHFHMKLTVF